MKEIYYNLDGRKTVVNTRKFSFFDSGSNAMALKNGDKVLKLYNWNTLPDKRINPLVFEYLKTVNSPSFIKFIDAYLFDLPSEGSKKEDLVIDFYLAKYYQTRDFNVLNVDKDYLLDSFREFDRLGTDEFALHRLAFNDLLVNNTVCTSDGIVIIDPDDYCFLNVDIDIIKHHNKRALWLLFIYFCIAGLSRAFELTEVSHTPFELMSFSVTSKTDIAFEMSNLLNRCRKPIDYFR